MKILKYILSLSFFALAFSCTDNFQEINTNPNAPVKVQPELLLRQVIYNFGDEMAYEGFVAGNLLGQYFTAIDFNLFDRHSLTEPQFGGNPWPTLYTNLRDNEIILREARANNALAVYEGPALILKAYFTATLTDLYGDVPYSEALRGDEGIVTPAYDSQEMIYTGANGILDNLNTAIEKLESYSGASTLEGDILFGGDLNAWIRFANSLRIKYLMRIADRVDNSSTLQAIYDADNYIGDNTQNAVFNFSASQPNNFRMANLRAGDFNLFILSETMQEILTNLQDPRLELFFRPTANDPGSYQGFLNGPDASQTSISVADYSLSGRIFREEPGGLQANFMTAWETHFLLAEAAERGLLTADAQSLYEEGVQMAFDYWNTSLPTDYLTTGSAAYGQNAQDKMEQIITQKWIANIINGYEGWTEYRRTGFPTLKTVAASLNNDLIPVRMPYPTDEDALNNENFVAATEGNGNSVNVSVWWDTE